MSNEEKDTDLHNMAKTMANDLRTLQAELNAEKEKRALAEKRDQERQEYLEKLEKSVKAVKEEKIETYGNILKEDVNPYFETLKTGASDPKLVSAVEFMQKNLENGLNNAFMDENENHTLRLVTAIASADKVRSSDLERMLKTEKQWGEKYQLLLDEKENLKNETESKHKELEESVKLKSEMLETLKKELDTLRTQAEKNKSNINNTDAHFDVEMTEKIESKNPSSSLVQTVASAASIPKSGIDSLFDFRPRTNWRSAFPDPGPINRNNQTSEE